MGKSNTRAEESPQVRLPFSSPNTGQDLLVFFAIVLTTGLLGHWLSSHEAAIRLDQRPQTPRPPYPYTSTDVTFLSSSPDGEEILLAGTLTIPIKPGPHPAVVLISGAGAQDRQGTLAGHKRTLVLADALARKGIAALRTDDRGVGGSAGNSNEARLPDLAADARAAVRFLIQQKGIDPQDIGLIGNSMGTLVATMAATTAAANSPPEDSQIKFLVLISAPALPGVETLVDQNRRVAEAQGLPKEDIERTTTLLQQALDLRPLSIPEEQKRQEVRQISQELLKLSSGTGANLVGAESRVERMVDVWLSPIMADNLEYDPSPLLQSLRIPVLVLYGDLDLQVPPDLHLPAMQKALTAAASKMIDLEFADSTPHTQSVEEMPFRIESLPRLNHLLQPATTGHPQEYGKIETTIAPAALQLITRWITTERPSFETHGLPATGETE